MPDVVESELRFSLQAVLGDDDSAACRGFVLMTSDPAGVEASLTCSMHVFQPIAQRDEQ